jgi:hypothetical protein
MITAAGSLTAAGLPASTPIRTMPTAEGRSVVNKINPHSSRNVSDRVGEDFIASLKRDD